MEWIKNNHRILSAYCSGMLLWLILMWGPGVALAQNIQKVEYFFDTDPGFGAGVAVDVDPPSAHLSNFNFNIGITGLDDGFHKLFVRTQNENGVWSLTNHRAFYKNTLVPVLHDLTKVEYFFDTDPGFGSGTDVPITPTAHLSDLSFSIDLTSLADGFHHLYVRTQNSNGEWSLNSRRAFLKNTMTLNNPQITQVEYFIDNDPGFGLATQVPVNPNGNNINIDFVVDLTSLPDGFHSLFARAKDDQGIWSLTSRRAFLKNTMSLNNPLITQVEYFIDNDPGFGLATSVPVNPNGNNINIDFVVDLTSLPDGFHSFFVRAKDDQNIWSLTSRRSFLKKSVITGDKEIIAMEYFFNTDPGFGQGTTIPITSSTDVEVLDFTIDLTSLQNGLHKLFVRARNEDGVWSLTNTWNFYKTPFAGATPNIVAAEYFFNSDPGLGMGTAILVPGNSSSEDLDVVIDISNLNVGFNKLFVRTKDATGRWSHTNNRTFYKKPFIPELLDIVYAEYFIDTDPGFGQGINIPIPNPGPHLTDIVFEIDETQLIMGNHSLFVRTRDEYGHWSQTLLDIFCRTPKPNFATTPVFFGTPTTFVDLSEFTNEYTQYYWDVDGNGTTDYTYSNGFNHLFTTPGVYNARLILVSQEGCSDTIVKPVYVYSCDPPTNLFATDITATSATLNWTAANIETTWSIEYGTSGFVQGTGTLIENVTNNSYPLTGLSSATEYNFYVKSVCGVSYFSSWAGPGEFETLEGDPCQNPADGGEIASSHTICAGSYPNPFTSESPATGHLGVLQYQWQISTNGMDFNDISGANAASYTHNAVLNATTWFRRLARVSCQPDWTNAAISNIVQVSIEAASQYRTVASGDWDDPAIWEVHDGVDWVQAIEYPGETPASCTSAIAIIQDGHTVTTGSDVIYANVEVSSGGTLIVQEDVELTITAGSAIIVYGNLKMQSTALIKGAGNFTLASGSTIHVGSTLGISISDSTGNIQVTGTRTYASGASYVYIGTSNQVTGDGLMQNTPKDFTINAPGVVVTLSQAINISGSIQIIQGTLDVNNFDITLAGHWINTGIFVPGTATVYFSNTVHVTVSVSNFFNIVFAGSDTVSATGQLTIYGNLTINNYFYGGSYTHYVYGNWVNNGVYVYGTSTIHFMGSGSITVTVSNFYNIIFGGTGTVTALGSLTIFGEVTINNYFDPGEFVHYVYGNWTNNGVFVYGTSTIHFLGSGNIIVGGGSFYHVIFGGTGTVTASGTLTFYGNVTINNHFAAGSYVHYVYGNWINNGTFDYGTSTISFEGSGNIVISASVFYNIVFGGNGTITAGGSLVIYGDVTINNHFNAGSYTHTVVGTWTNNGTFDYGTSTVQFTGSGNINITVNNFYNVVFDGTGVFIATGSLTFYGSVVINSTFDGGSFVHYVYGNWTNNGEFIYGTSTIHFAGTTAIFIGTSEFYHVIFGGSGTVTAQGSITFNGDVTINNYFDAGSYVHYVYGGWFNYGTFVYGTSTITFVGTGNINLDVNSFYHVVFGGTGTIIATGSLTFYGNVTINNYFVAGSYVHYVYGNWINNGTFVYGTSTIHFTGSANITVGISNFYHVIFGGTGTVTAIGSLTFFGDVTINNYFDAGSYVHYVYGGWFNTGTFVYGTSTITFIGSGNISLDVNSFYHVVFGGTGNVTAIGSLTIYGNITINNYFNAGSFVHYIYGQWYNYGIFVYGTSTIHFMGTGYVTLGNESFYNVIFGGSGTIEATGSLTFYGNVTIDHYFAGGSYVHYVHGNWTNNGVFVYGTSTIHFAGSVNITISAGSFYHVIFGGTGTIVATGSLNIYGNITINNYFDAGSYEHYIYGYWYNYGIFVYGTSTIHFVGSLNITLGNETFYHVVFGGTGTVVATASLTFYGNVTINNYFDAGSFIHCVYGNWINTGTFVYGTSTIHFLGTVAITIGSSSFYHVIFAGSGTITATGTLYIYGNITINNHFNAGSYEHYVYGNWVNNGVFVYGTSTIRFVGSANLQIGVENFYHVVFARNAYITAVGSLTIYGDITISNHFDAGSFTHYVRGRWINNGNFVYSTSTIVFDGTVQQTIEGSEETEFYGITVNNSYGILMYMNFRVRYLLVLTTGIITTSSYVITVYATADITGGSVTSYIYGRLIREYTGVGSRFFPVGTASVYGPLTLNYLTLTGTSLVEIQFAGGTIPGTIPGAISNVADHYWIISQTGGISFTFNITLNFSGYSPAGMVRILRGNGFTVNHYATTSPHYTSLLPFDEFGDFTLGDIHCQEPDGLINRYVTYTSAILDWNQNGSPQSWNVEYGPSGFSPGTGTLLTDVTVRPLEITGLTSESYYEFYVQAKCSDEVQSAWVGPAPFSTFPKQLDATIFLEGPYDETTDLMATTLAGLGMVPLSQPYSGAPWNYNGTEQVAAIPTEVVDWVLIEWRDAANPANATGNTWIWRKAAFLKDDGSIVDMDGSSLPWIGNPQLSGSLFVIVRHRNHVDVISNYGATLSGQVYEYDYSGDISQVYGGSSGYRQIDASPLRYGMAAGDGNGDGQVQSNLDVQGSWSQDAGKRGYYPGDFDMNGQVQNQDKNDYLTPNIGKATSIPE